MNSPEFEILKNQVRAVIAAAIADVKLGKQHPIDAADLATLLIVRKIEHLLSSISIGTLRDDRVQGGANPAKY